MREEIETFMALRLINEVDANASKTTLQVSAELEDKNTSSFETAIVQEVHKLEEVKTPIHEEMAKKIMSSPLLDAFQKQINNTEAPPLIMPEEVSKIEIDEELPFPISIEESEANNSENNTENLVTDTMDTDKAAEHASDRKEASDFLYSDAESTEEKTKLESILDEEYKEAIKVDWRWILWFILIGLLAALLWWLFQTNEYKRIERIMMKTAQFILQLL
jgi:hypothetical protein